MASGISRTVTVRTQSVELARREALSIATAGMADDTWYRVKTKLVGRTTGSRSILVSIDTLGKGG